MATQKTSMPLIKKVELIFLGTVGLVIFLFIACLVWQKYENWRFNREVAAIQAEADRPYLEDTYGGKTPQETLEMFIAAVEKGDYDLASKYFILSKQEEWRNRFNNGDNKKIKEWLELVKKVKEKEYITPERFQMELRSSDGKVQVVVNFLKYSQGIWKIEQL